MHSPSSRGFRSCARTSWAAKNLCALLAATCLLTTQGSKAHADPKVREHGQPRHTALTAAIVRTLAASPLSFFSTLVARAVPQSKRAAVPTAGMTAPIFMAVTPDVAVGGVDTLTVTIRVDQVGDSIQLGTDKPWLLNSPSLDWPHIVPFPPGSATTRTLTLSTNLTSSNSSVTLYACRNGVDASNPANWSVVKTIMVAPIQAPGSGGP